MADDPLSTADIVVSSKGTVHQVHLVHCMHQLLRCRYRVGPMRAQPLSEGSDLPDHRSSRSGRETRWLELRWVIS